MRYNITRMGVRQRSIKRIRVITAVLLLIAVLLVARMYYLQVMQHDYYVERATSQYTHTVRDLYDRGNIYFTTKNDERVSAAAIKSGYVLAVDLSALTIQPRPMKHCNQSSPLIKNHF